MEAGGEEAKLQEYIVAPSRVRLFTGFIVSGCRESLFSSAHEGLRVPAVGGHVP